MANSFRLSAENDIERCKTARIEKVDIQSNVQKENRPRSTYGYSSNKFEVSNNNYEPIRIYHKAVVISRQMEQ